MALALAWVQVGLGLAGELVPGWIMGSQVSSGMQDQDGEF